MKAYHEMSPEEVNSELKQQRALYEDFVAKGLKLNMARGKPAPEQLELSMPLLNAVTATDGEALKAGAADDLRNYGTLQGIAAMRELMGALLGVPANNVLAAGNSSLTLMYNLVAMAMTQGICGSKPWSQLDTGVKFLCPSPGYDRHFAICEHFGIEMIVVPLYETGPDMDMVEQLVSSDPTVKGIWCVPRFANPTGCVYSDETVRRMAALKPAAEDFRIYWDNAYVVHELGDLDAELADGGGQDTATSDTTALMNLMDACEAAGHPNLWYQFASTSKITFAGAGVAALASSEENLKDIEATWSIQTIGPDKINQERHVRFLPNLEAVQAHMTKQAAIISPKFAVVQRVLRDGLGETGIGSWTNPRGGYFISFDGPPHTAKRTVELAKQAGVVLTPAGATYPYGKDPEDSNIRIAPTYPSLDELELAAEVFVVCARIAALEQLTHENL